MARHDPIDVKFQVVAEKQFQRRADTFPVEGLVNWVIALAMWGVAAFGLHTLLSTPPL